MLSSKQVAKLIDHALLRPDMTRDEVREGVLTAIRCGAKSVCVRSCDVAFARQILSGSDVECGCVVGFPHANCSTAAKAEETRQAFRDGVHEVDMVLPIGLLKSGEYDLVYEDIHTIREICAEQGAIVKVIFENCYLTKDEIVKACEISSRAKVDFVKTSTGFGTSGALLEDVILMKKSVEAGIQVKASGGIRTLDDVLAFWDAGATRIGASATEKIVEEARRREGSAE
ncbi:MAG: deoxyribose-phosphate aldolase [Eubacteriaceae bacterium]|nr:deoxyribose-phosphate aldolase [Eubacteriaceae bacterium]